MIIWYVYVISCYVVINKIKCTNTALYSINEFIFSTKPFWVIFLYTTVLYYNINTRAVDSAPLDFERDMNKPVALIGRS